MKWRLAEPVDATHGEWQRNCSSLSEHADIVQNQFEKEAKLEMVVETTLRAAVREYGDGLTIVAIGSSLPELAICVSAARRREPLVAVGNVLGSNAFNLLGAMGIVAVVTDVGTANMLMVVDLGIMLAVTVALTILLLHVGRIGRVTGCIFLCVYLAYLAGQFTHM